MFLSIKPVSLRVKHVSILNLIVNSQKQPFKLYYRICMEILYYTGKLLLANYDLVEYVQKLLDRFNKTLHKGAWYTQESLSAFGFFTISWVRPFVWRHFQNS